VARFAERVQRVLCFYDPLLRIDSHNRRSENEFSLLNPLMAESPAYQQISGPQSLVVSCIHTRHYRPIFELYRWLLGLHGKSSPIFWMRPTLLAAKANLMNSAEDLHPIQSSRGRHVP
jgi:hypothetical protein